MASKMSVTRRITSSSDPIKQIMNSMTLSSPSEEFHRCLKLLQQVETAATLGFGRCLKFGRGRVGSIAACASRHCF